MQFRQQRRRRLWPDEVLSVDAATPRSGAGRSAGPAESYTAQARRELQPRLTDLIPIRYRTLTAIYMAALCMIGGLVLLHHRLDDLARHVAREALGAFDLADRGSFAHWYASLLLSLTAATAALLYSLRRHRIDDYRGRYRMWIWVPFVWLLLAIHQTSQLEVLVRTVVEQSAAWAGCETQWLWPGACIALGLFAAIRLTFEVRRSRGAVMLLWLGALCWLAAASVPRLQGSLPTASAETMLVVGLRMAAFVNLLAAHVAYARYVLLDAHGLLPQRGTVEPKAVSRRRKKAPADAPAAEGGAVPKPHVAARTDLDPPSASESPRSTPAAAAKASPAPPAARVSPLAAKIAAATASDDDEEDDDQDGDNSATAGLSRSERKRLRRLQKLERRNAA